MGATPELTVGKSGCTVAQAKAKFSTEHYNRTRHEAELEHLRRVLDRVPPRPPPEPVAAERDDTDWRCPTGEQAGRRGYCAAGRCYCGHTACHAYPTWVDLHRPTPPQETR